VTDFQFVGRYDKFAAIPKAGGWFYGEAIYGSGYAEYNKSGEVINSGIGKGFHFQFCFCLSGENKGNRAEKGKKEADKFGQEDGGVEGKWLVFR